MSQRYIFDATLSKLWDFITFPMLSKTDPSEKDSDADDDSPILVDEAYTSMCKHVKLQLSPFKPQIESFYFEDSFNLITILGRRISLVSYSDLFAYLDAFQQIPKVELVTMIHYAGLARGDYACFQPDLWEQATHLANHPEEAFNFLNAKEYTSETKWHLLTLLQDPHGAIKRYGELMKQLEPIFEATYAPYAPNLEADGTALVSRLNSIEGDSFSQLTDGMISASLFATFPVYINFSYLFGYSLAIIISIPPPEFDDMACSIVGWGANLETYFAQLKDYSKHQQTERILMLKNLGDNTRYQVAQCIANGVVSTKIIAEQLGVTAATVSYHLNQLTASKIIMVQAIDGKFQYTINKAVIEKALDAIRLDLCGK